MSDIALRREHDLGIDGAKELAHETAEKLKQELPHLITKIDWSSDGTTAQLKGKGFTGTFKVAEREMSIEIDLSFFLKPLAGKVEQQIKDRISGHFS